MHFSISSLGPKLSMKLGFCLFLKKDSLDFFSQVLIGIHSPCGFQNGMALHYYIPRTFFMNLQNSGLVWGERESMSIEKRGERKLLQGGESFHEERNTEESICRRKEVKYFFAAFSEGEEKCFDFFSIGIEKCIL